MVDRAGRRTVVRDGSLTANRPCGGSSAAPARILPRKNVGAAPSFPLRALSANPLLCWKPNRSSVSCAGGCSASTVAFFVRVWCSNPPQSTVRTLRTFWQLPVRLAACCEQVLGTKKVCRPCRFRVSERGIVHRRCAGQGWPFRHFSLRLTVYPRCSNCFSG